MFNKKTIVKISFLNLRKGTNSTNELVYPSSADFKCEFLKDMDKIHEGLGKKVQAAMKRVDKGTSNGIHVLYRDEDNLIQHITVTMFEQVY